MQTSEHLNGLIPAVPLQPATDLLFAYPIAIPVLLLVCIIGPKLAWNKFVAWKHDRYEPVIQEWSDVRRRTFRLMFIEDDWPALTKPKSLAQEH